jgi:hypothetical protein
MCALTTFYIQICDCQPMTNIVAKSWFGCRRPILFLVLLVKIWDKLEVTWNPKKVILKLRTCRYLVRYYTGFLVLCTRPTTLVTPAPLMTHDMINDMWHSLLYYKCVRFTDSIFHWIGVQWNRSERFHWTPIQWICMRKRIHCRRIYVYFLFLFDSWQAMHEVHDKLGPILIRDKAFRPCTCMGGSTSTM